MSVDEAKAKAYVLMHKTGFKYWALYPKEIKAMARAAVVKGEEGYADYFRAIVDREDLVEQQCRGMNSATVDRAVELCVNDAALIAIMVSKAGPPKSKAKVQGQSPPPAPAPLPPPGVPGSVVKEGMVELERLWLNPVPLLGKKAGFAWKQQWAQLRNQELRVYDSPPQQERRSWRGQAVPAQPSWVIGLRGASLSDTKQLRVGKFAFRLNYVSAKVSGHKLILSSGSLQETLEWVEAFQAAGVQSTFEGHGMREVVPRGGANADKLGSTFSEKLASSGTLPLPLDDNAPSAAAAGDGAERYAPLQDEDVAAQVLAGDEPDEDEEPEPEEETEPTEDQLEAALVFPDEPTEANLQRLRLREFSMPASQLLFGTKMLRALWVMTFSMLLYALYDIAMVSTRCSRSGVWCLFAVTNSLGTSSFLIGCALGTYMVAPPVLRRYSVEEVKKRQDKQKAQLDWERLDLGSKYCWGNLVVLPNFIMAVGTNVAFVGALVLAAATYEWEALAIWLELSPFAVLLWWLCLEPQLQQNNRSGSSYCWHLLAERPPWSASLRDALETKLKYYLAPDVWMLVVLTAAGYSLFPLGILVFLVLFPGYFTTWWYALATGINFASAVMLYRASQPQNGGGQEASLKYESADVFVATEVEAEADADAAAVTAVTAVTADADAAEQPPV